MKNVALDIRDIVNLENFSGLIPIFPLPSMVFFPNTLLPLYIFEPRYKQMVNDVMENERIIGMALMKPETENQERTHGFFDIVGMGRIISAEPLEEGKYNIVLYGLKRVKIKEIVNHAPYNTARVELLEDKHGLNENDIRQRILEIVSKWNVLLGKGHDSHKINIDPTLGLEQISDAIAATQFSNVYEKQDLLEESDIEMRANKVLSHLETKYEVVSIMERKKSSLITEKRHLN